MWRFFAIILCAPLVFWPASAHAGSCKIKSDHILYLKGDTDEKMFDCVREKDLTGIDTVLLKSRGGNVVNAMKIGDLIAPLNAKMIVKDYCNSSCANYFLPLASTITVEPYAELMLHGSFDSGIVRQAKADQRSELWEPVSQQYEYAVRHRIHRGWLMYRSHYAKQGGDYYLYIEGDFGWMDRDDPVSFLQVEPRFFESCFPDIPIVFESPTLIDDANQDEKLRTKFLKQGLRPTGNWTCKGAFDPDWPIPSEEDRQVINSE